eukprot:TRINITY_DN1210_c0_g1_i2.p1 TRINITY_DN1210_c0_g1~~TRINITY_DN1210_c0_g1_i2.p1  ORF type:complete len:933 (+),score=352.71 TRINITY_DN1210_c0_g1_i2:350-3148(+)
MGRKRQKVRWLSIEDTGSDETPSGLSPEIERSNSLSPMDSQPAHRGYFEKTAYGGRRPVAPRFERKAAVLMESVVRNRELSGDSGEDLPMGFTKIRSKNLDVLFKKDYYSTKGGCSSEANTHSETSSLTQREDEKELEMEEPEEEDGAEEVFQILEEEESIAVPAEQEAKESNKTNNEGPPKLSKSKLNGSSSPFYPSSSPGYVMPIPPYVTGRPNLFLYSPSSNTMIPCEEIVVPGLYPGSPASSPQNVYLAAFPMEGSLLMSQQAYHHPYYPPQPVYSDAEPSSAESTVPHSPPELSAYNPAYWGGCDAQLKHRVGGYYNNSPYGNAYNPSETAGYSGHQGNYPSSGAKSSPPESEGVHSPSLFSTSSKKMEETEAPRVPGLPPQPKKSQKKKRKKKSKPHSTSEILHRNSTSSEEGRTLKHDHLKEEEEEEQHEQQQEEVVEKEPQHQVSFDESSKKSVSAATPPCTEQEDPSPTHQSAAPLQEEEEVIILKENCPEAELIIVQENFCPTEEDPLQTSSSAQVEEGKMLLDPSPPPQVEEGKMLLDPSPPPQVEEGKMLLDPSPPPLVEKTEEEVSQVQLSKESEDTESTKQQPSSPPTETEEEKPEEEEGEVKESINPRMLYSSVVSQSMPNLPKSSTPPNIVSKANKAPLEVPTSPSKEPLKKKKKVVQPEALQSVEEATPNAQEDEWLESSSRKKRQRQLKKPSKPLPPIKRSLSLDTSPKEPPPQEEPSVSLSTSLLVLEEVPTEEDDDPMENSSACNEKDSSPQEEEKTTKAEEALPESLPTSENKKPPAPKKKKNKRGKGDSSKLGGSSGGETSESSTKPVLIVDGALDVSSSFSSLKRVSDFGSLRIHSQPLSKGLDTLFISDVGLGIRNGPIMSGRPLRMGKYNPPDRAEEILSMKAAVLNEEPISSSTTTKENAQFMSLD